jgi:hypothetical protein
MRHKQKLMTHLGEPIEAIKVERGGEEEVFTSDSPNFQVFMTLVPTMGSDTKGLEERDRKSMTEVAQCHIPQCPLEHTSDCLLPRLVKREFCP